MIRQGRKKSCVSITTLPAENSLYVVRSVGQGQNFQGFIHFSPLSFLLLQSGGSKSNGKGNLFSQETGAALSMFVEVEAGKNIESGGSWRFLFWFTQTPTPLNVCRERIELLPVPLILGTTAFFYVLSAPSQRWFHDKGKNYKINPLISNKI